jgi:ABC-type Zn uptake system ZnuABC Zn-binding protein ZnuA
MGLDMYLNKKSFLFTGDYVNENEREAVEVTKGGKPHPAIKQKRIKEVVEEVAYWRKANHIHQWFVENIQKGIDDCGEYSVPFYKLEELVKVCKKVLKDQSKASELLPTQGGFFFGSTEYDEHYFYDVENTVRMLEEVLSEDGAKDQEYSYQSSW